MLAVLLMSQYIPLILIHFGSQERVERKLKLARTVRGLESKFKSSNLVPTLCSMYRVHVGSAGVKVKGLARRTVASNVTGRR